MLYDDPYTREPLFYSVLRKSKGWFKVTMVSKHFALEEFKCPCGCGLLPNIKSSLFLRLVDGLETYRKTVGNEPVVIVSGIRCHKHNDSLAQSATNSPHLPEHYGAADVLPELTIKRVTELHAFTGLGYENWPSSPRTKGLVTHVDVVHPARVTAPITWPYPWK